MPTSERQQFRKAAAATQVCIPVGAAGATKCRTTRLGAPSDQLKTTLLTLEGRRIYAGQHVGINSRFTADLEDDLQTYELPIYFLREAVDASKNPVPSLNGGVSCGCHSKNGAVLRVFVGVAFRLVNIK